MPTSLYIMSLYTCIYDTCMGASSESSVISGLPHLRLRNTLFALHSRYYITEQYYEAPPTPQQKALGPDLALYPLLIYIKCDLQQKQRLAMKRSFLWSVLAPGLDHLSPYYRGICNDVGVHPVIIK